ncbi:MAG: ATP-binding protein [Cyanobacteria bacterium P01_A01_bin.68]
MKILYEDSLIKFDFDTGLWVCDIAKIKIASLTDDVIEVMALQLQKLPEETQYVLKLAACIGNQFDLSTLAVVCQKSEVETAADLWRALQEGLVLPTSEVYKFYLESKIQIQDVLHKQIVNYKFLHDTVQQAAYYLIPDSHKQTTHLKIGQLLLSNTPDIELDNRIFDIVNQLNMGLELIDEPYKREQLAQLNLMAGNKAKVATAYAAAVSYLNIGLKLLSTDSWQNQYELTLKLHELLAESEYLNTNFEASKNIVDRTLLSAKNSLDKIKVYEIQIQSYTAQNKLIEAINIGREALNLLDIDFPLHCDLQRTIAEHQKLKTLLGDRPIETLPDLQNLDNSNQEAALRILSGLFASVYLAKPELLPLKIFAMMKICIQYGNSPQSAITYNLYGLFLCATGEIEPGYKFGELARIFLERFQVKDKIGKVNLIFGLFIKHWKKSVRSTLPVFLTGLNSALENGDLEYVGYCSNCYFQFLFWAGDNLKFVESEANKHCELIESIKQETSLIWGNTWRQTVINLRGKAEEPTVLVGSCFNEFETLPSLIQSQNVNGICYIYLAKLILLYLFGDYQSANEYASKFEEYEQGTAGLLIIPLKNFYQSLNLLSLYSSADTAQKTVLLEKIGQNQKSLQTWAHYAPMNHLHKFQLVEAENYRVDGKNYQAGDWYDRAISGAKDNNYLQEEALANELAAKFYLDWSKEKIAISYMQEAYYCYARWGAKAKTDDLEKRYPQLLAPILQNQFHKLETTQTYSQNPTIQTTIASLSSIDESLDFASILKSSQTLSSEIQLERLISQLMQVVMENAGASKAALLLQKEDNLILEALASSNKDIKLLNIPFQESENISHTIVNIVKRNLKTVVLDNATTQNDFIADSYLIQQKPKSLLCIPILNQGKLIGLLYLENQLTASAFTQKRVEILSLLITQAAISLENAQLYDKLELKVEERTLQFKQKANQLESTLKELQSTQAQLIQSEKMYALGKLVAGIAHEINNPISFIYGNLTPVEEYSESFIELFNLYQKKYPQPLPEIESKIVDLDLEFIIDDLPKLLYSMKTGAQRIREIVLSLRNFSRLDEAEIKSVDINSGIDSTLLILQHELKSNNKYPDIEIIKEYSPLPKVTCYASKLNQVFMNIIGNGIDALRDKQEKEPRITIRTSQLDSQNILISIADNGIGMSKLVVNQIFDPFFTTKPVGSGTGLGLSTSYSIVVEKHGGKLSCVSTPGEGTEFVIQLPLCH